MGKPRSTGGEPRGEAQLAAYRAAAAAAVEEAREIFVSRLGSAPALYKGKGDFATAADLEIEALLRERLGEASGIPVFGEERGGELVPDACWVVDPIDGTSNYSCGNPNCAILVSLILDGQPVVALTDIPLLRLHLSAVAGGPVFCNGEPLPPVSTLGANTGANPGTDDLQTAPAVQVGVGSVRSVDQVHFPPEGRLSLIAELAEASLRPRISGSVGVDLAFVALGIYRAAVSFSPHVWDNAAGVLLARSAGATVTDAAGLPWELGSMGAITGTPQAHRSVLDTMERIRSTA